MQDGGQGDEPTATGRESGRRYVQICRIGPNASRNDSCRKSGKSVRVTAFDPDPSQKSKVQLAVTTSRFLEVKREMINKDEGEFTVCAQVCDRPAINRGDFYQEEKHRKAEERMPSFLDTSRITGDLNKQSIWLDALQPGTQLSPAITF